MPVNADKLTIVHYPQPVLRTKAQPLEQIDDEVRAVALRMIELMHEARGVGLAAPQVGLSWRLFVANATGNPGPDDHVYINPALSEPNRHTDKLEEGCLSIPDVRAPIMRPTQITITATDLEGQTFTQTDDQLLARIWQHEYDHLDGVLILDRMTPADRKFNRRAIEALEQTAR
jgi:peptide deformylase